MDGLADDSDNSALVPSGQNRLVFARFQFPENTDSNTWSELEAVTASLILYPSALEVYIFDLIMEWTATDMQLAVSSRASPVVPRRLAATSNMEYLSCSWLRGIWDHCNHASQCSSIQSFPSRYLIYLCYGLCCHCCWVSERSPIHGRESSFAAAPHTCGLSHIWYHSHACCVCSHRYCVSRLAFRLGGIDISAADRFALVSDLSHRSSCSLQPHGLFAISFGSLVLKPA